VTHQPDDAPLMGKVLAELRFGLFETVRAATWLTALAAALGGLCGLLGAFSTRLDLASHFAPLWLAAGFGAAGIGVLIETRRFKWPVVLGIAGALAAAVLMAPDITARALQRPAPAKGEQLKLVQLNLWGSNADLPRTARWILREDPDIVLLEEAASSAILPMLKARYPYQTTCAHPHSCAPMILTRTPPLAHGGTSTTPQPNLTWVTLDGEAPFTVAAVHQVKPYARVQPVQIALGARQLKDFDQGSLIIAGDFNATPWSWSMRGQDTALGLERRTRALASWPTWSPLPLLPIDHVYAGQAWRTVDVRRGPPVGSDHYPIVVTLARPVSGGRAQE